MELSPLTVMLLLISFTGVPQVQECSIWRPEAVVVIKPDRHVFIGETVTLSCDIQERRNADWKYSWNKSNSTLYTDSTMFCFSISSVSFSDSGDYTCRGQSGDSQSSEISDAVTLIVSERAQVVLSVSPQNWLTEGDSVTFCCEVTNSSTGWTFTWFTAVPYRTIRGSQGDICEGFYTLSPVTLFDTGVYVCESERGESTYYRSLSNQQPVWITGESPPVSMIINPNRTQHFANDFLSLSCEDQNNSSGWTVGRYTDRGSESDCSWWGSVKESICKINSLSPSCTGVYWCESKSGNISNPVNITVHDGDVILESPVHPVTEGHPLTLRCLYHNTNSSDVRADFYKDGSVLQNKSTGEMIIHNVSKSDEGFYHCKHPDMGESPKSWVSVRALGSTEVADLSGVEAPFSVLMLISSVVTVSPYLLVTIILLLKCYRARALIDEDRFNCEVIQE